MKFETMANWHLACLEDTSLKPIQIIMTMNKAKIRNRRMLVILVQADNKG